MKSSIIIIKNRGGEHLKVKVKIDPNVKDTEVLITAEKNSKFIDNLINMILDYEKKKLTSFTAYIGDRAFIINVMDVIRIYAANQKVYIQTADSEYLIKHRLYELEDLLERNQFLRISNSEIVNMKKIVDIDLSITGRVRICLSGGIQTYVSKRYISKIKKSLGI